MNVVVREKDGLWSIWVTEKPGDDQAPIFTARGRTAEQVVTLLPVILAMETAAPVTASEVAPQRARTAPVRRPSATSMNAAKREALQAVRDSLDGWIEGAKENHESMDHRYENIGEECWRTFTPDDIRNMINEAAGQVGVEPFATPNPVEDRT